MTLGERILEAIRYRPLDDDQLAKRLQISQRQSINQTARKLEARGLLRRYAGPDGKLVNELVVGSTESELESAGTGVSVADSTAQRRAEPQMLSALGSALGVELSPRRLQRGSGARVEIDGASGDLSVLAECWAHQGRAKVAQQKKLLSDAMKLQWVASWLEPKPEKLILCVSDEAAVAHLRGKSWQGEAIRDAGVEIYVVTLDDSIVASIVEAQVRQYR